MFQDAAFGSYRIIAFVGTSNPDAARHFYRDLLGLRLVDEDGFALVFDAGGTTLRVTIVKQVRAAEYTVLGWDVPDIVTATAVLRAAGIALERYPGLAQDEDGIWTSPAGGRVVWFKDPDGNTLGITQRQ